jgi:hypothetical protein
MRRAYAAYALAILGFYGFAAWRGWDLGSSGRRGLIPASVRQSPGGYRSYNYWRGGK